MSRPPAAGERDAVRGYRWQYDHIAHTVYDAFLDGNFEALRLTDPEAGRVDDLVLVRRGRVDGYQFKSVAHDSYVTFNQLAREQKTRGGNPSPSILRSLGDGWKRLNGRYENVHVHIVLQQLASIRDHLGEEGVERPSPDHFSAFLEEVLNPLQSRQITLEDVAPGWRPAIEKLRDETGVEPNEFERFAQAFHLDVAAGSGLPPAPSTRRSDIIALSHALFRLVSTSADVVELDERQLLALVGWSDRPLLHSRHEFPVDLDAYAPLDDAIEELKGLLARHRNGYVAVVGPPGTGKSTLLSQALTGSAERVIRYYAYVPGTAPARARLTARGFLHDVVVMLNEAGLEVRERELPSSDVHELRQQLHYQLDAARAEYEAKRRRTIVVVDGLDHVDRDHPGPDGLLAELPRPDELPDGVLIVVGSRTLQPLHAFARQQVHERHAVVDLRQHRLSPTVILDLCRRAPVTADLPVDVHERIAELSDGHPLALGYLLNRLRDVDPEDALDALASARAYAGDIAAEYLAVWDGLEDDDDLLEILVVCSRLRIGITTEWLTTWAPLSAVRRFQRKLLYLFREHHDGWRFFHDSFRQFAADHTALADSGGMDDRRDALVHSRVAELCASSDDPKLQAEELYHRYCAGEHDQVLLLAQQPVFREQYRRLRSPDLIRSDIQLALGVAADRADVLVVVRLLFALVEEAERTAALEHVDIPGLLYDAGLVDEAIAYCSSDPRGVPLAHAYDLAARLGQAGEPAGRWVFDLVEHKGFDDPDRMKVSGQEDDAAIGWTRAAALFRPLPAVLEAIRDITTTRSDRHREDKYRRAGGWRRYERMMEVLIDSFVLRSDEGALIAIDAALAEHGQLLAGRMSDSLVEEQDSNDDEDTSSKVARLADLRVRVYAGLVELATSADVVRSHLEALLAMLRGVPLFYSTMLDAAELFGRHDMVEPAVEFLDHIESQYGKAITVHDLGALGEADVVDSRFRYWWLRCHLAADPCGVPHSVSASGDTPAGDSVAQDAPVHQDLDAIELAGRVDVAVRTLAWMDAATASGEPLPVTEAWIALGPLLDTFRPVHNRSRATLGGMAQRKPDLVRLIVTVAINHSVDLAERLRDLLTSRFSEQSDRWSPKLRLDVADYFRSAGLDVAWYQESLLAEQSSATGQDVLTRLDDTAALMRRYAGDGDIEEAQRLVLALIPMAFGVGYRKDYQFNSWVAWLDRALRQHDGIRFLDDAAWLARVLTAADPMTEGAPGFAASDLPAAVVPADPAAAVRIFEYLVRHGTVNHLDALATLVRALVTLVAEGDEASVQLASDLIAELIAPAANHAYPDTAAALVTTARSVLGKAEAGRLAESIADRTDTYTLPTIRHVWRDGLGLPAEDQEPDADESTGGDVDEYGALILVDGRRIARTEVPSLIHGIDDIVALRRQEANESSFSWAPVIEEHAVAGDDLRILLQVFNDGSERSSEVLVSLAEIAERSDDPDTALSLSHNVMSTAPGNAWSPQYNKGARLRAAAIVVRLGEQDARVAMCQDLARQVSANRWLAGLLLDELDKTLEALDPGIGPREVWPAVKAYLEGLAETLELPTSEVLPDHGCRWWLLPSTSDRRVSSDESTPAVALAELAVGHLSHPTWLVRDAATTIVVRALIADNMEVAKTLGRFALPDASDDTLERAGRCLAAARSHERYTVPEVLRPLERTLSSHQSQVLRDLIAEPEQVEYRPLSPTYRLTLPPPAAAPIGSEPVFLAPHESQYKLLAEGLNLDIDTVLAIAGQYATRALALLPNQDTVREALDAAHMKLAYPSEKIAASRAAFGRVLADLKDARLLVSAPEQILHRLRTVDIELLGTTPVARPPLVPPPPEAGHEQTIERWRASTNQRLDDYVSASRDEKSVLIGAKSRLTVLNWGHLEEEFTCGTTIGKASHVNEPLARVDSLVIRDLADTWENGDPEDGEPLIIEHIGHTFHQLQADWLAFRPDIATALEWEPDMGQPGRWFTASGELAVDTMWWVDGWWGRAGPAFDDTASDGYAVVLTSKGLDDVGKTLGGITRSFTLIRRGRENGEEVGPFEASRSIPVAM